MGNDSVLAIEIRKFPRRQFTAFIGVLVSGNYKLMKCLELGEGGLAFLSEEKIEIGRQIIVTFQIPGGAFVATTAEIRHAHLSKEGKYSQGCLFANIKFERKREIRAFVSARL